MLESFVRYSRYVSVLKWLTLSLFAYECAVAFVVHAALADGHPQSRRAPNLVQLRLPHGRRGDPRHVTIRPYLFFWQAEEEVEDERERPGAKPLTRAPEQAAAEFHRIRVDTYLGMGLSNLVALFIMITAAATLNANGDSTYRRRPRRPRRCGTAGPCVFLIFSLGIIGTGLLALPVLAGSSAYAVGEAFGWHVGLARKPARAERFYFTIAAITAAGAVLNVVALDPFKALFWSAVINGRGWRCP